MSSTPKRSSKQSEASVPNKASHPVAKPNAVQESASLENAQTPELVRPVRPAIVQEPPLLQPPSIPVEIVKPTIPLATHAPQMSVAEGESVPEVAIEDDVQPSTRLHPIPPPSERMQYRAIGLIRGKYKASDDQLTRGLLVTTDGTEIDAVLLGRIISLIKKHINLEEEHLWVVYPRTREKESDLHAQIAGIWEPEKLHQAKLEDGTDNLSSTDVEDEPEQAVPSVETEVQLENLTDELPTVQPIPSSEFEDGYFSIRGEVVYQSEEDDKIIVKIRQTSRKAKINQEKAFKLLLQGELQERALGKFWDFQVKREADTLVIQSSDLIGIVPPKKKTPGSGSGRPPRRPGSGGAARKPWQSSRPGQSSSVGKPSPAPRPVVRKDSVAKPLKRKDKDLSSGS